MKRTISLAFALIFIVTAALFTLSSCTEAAVKYKTDVPVDNIADAMVAAASNGSDMAEMDGDFITYYIDSDLSALTEYTIRMQISGTSIDEIGVFKSDGSTAAEAVVKAYLKSRLDNWNPDYLESEYPKMQAAEYKIYGDYVIYAIIADSEKTAVFDAAAAMLK